MSGTTLFDGFGNIWAFDTAGVPYMNGVAIAAAAPITQLEYKNGSIYASDGVNWYRYTNNAFSASAAP